MQFRVTRLRKWSPSTLSPLRFNLVVILECLYRTKVMFGKGVLFEGSETGAIAIGFFIAQAKNSVAIAPDSDQTFQFKLTAGIRIKW